MTYQEIVAEIHKKKSFLCVGLDTDVNKLPEGFPKNAEGVLAFNKAIIEATQDLAVSFKVNTAFYEAMGIEGWQVLFETFSYLPKNTFNIADCKRGDIGNTSNMYAEAFFNKLQADAVTVAPYMGYDSVAPFLSYPNKWTIVLGLTSNEGSKDFQALPLENGSTLYNTVIEKVCQWGSPENLMFVTGATKSSYLSELRVTAERHFFLVPGVGAQGGNLQEVFQAAAIEDAVGLLVNASRSIIYASAGKDFHLAARREANSLQQEMKALLID